MTKFHVNPAGDAGPCSAKKNCPFGSASEHYDTVEEATAAAEQQLASEYGSTVGNGKTKEAPEQVAQRVAEAERVANSIDGQKIGGTKITGTSVSEDGTTITLGAEYGDLTGDPIEFPEEVDTVLENNPEFYDMSEDEAEYAAEQLASDTNQSIRAAYFSGPDSHAADFGAMLIEHHGDELPEGYNYEVEWSDVDYHGDSEFMDRWQAEQDNDD